MENHIEVVEYDPAWADAYGRAAARIGRALGDRLERIEHIGSTAVPGLGAKPIVDLRVMVGAEEALDDCVATLEAATNFAYVADMDGWTLLGREVSEVPDGERFPEDTVAQRSTRPRSNAREDGGAVKAYNCHLTTIDGEEWRKNVLLRDYLRDHVEARERYVRVKREAAREHPDDIKAYSQAKGGVIDDVLAKAREAGYAVRE